MSFRPARRCEATVAAAALLVTGCGSGDEPAVAERAATDEASGEYPVTIDTAFGEITIEEEPERVVALGWSDAETALALGVQPVGASDWLAVGGDDGLGDWVERGYDEPPVLIETLEPSFEEIAALEPDLILGTRSSGEEDRYELLSQIARPRSASPRAWGRTRRPGSSSWRWSAGRSAGPMRPPSSRPRSRRA